MRNKPQARFAARLGVSVPTLRGLEQGDTSGQVGHWLAALAVLGRLHEAEAWLAPQTSLFTAAEAASLHDPALPWPRRAGLAVPDFSLAALPGGWRASWVRRFDLTPSAPGFAGLAALGANGACRARQQYATRCAPRWRSSPRLRQTAGCRTLTSSASLPTSPDAYAHE